MTTTTVTLATIKRNFEGFDFKLPTPAPTDKKSLSEIVKAKMNQVILVRENVAQWLGAIAEVDNLLSSCKDSMERKIIRAEVGSKVQEALTAINDLLTSTDKIYRSAAAIAYLTYVFNRKFKDHQQFLDALKDLQERNLLVKMEDRGQIKIGYDHYRVGDTFGIDADDIKDLGELIAKFSAAFSKLMRKERKAKVTDLSKQANISLEQFRKASHMGSALLNVPAEMVEKPDRNRPGKLTYEWRGGGQLLVDLMEVDDEPCILPLMASGAIEGQIEHMANDGLMLKHKAIGVKTNHPPRTEDLMEFLMNPEGRNMSQDAASHHAKAMQKFFYMVNRAIRYPAIKRVNEKACKKVREAATITPAEFIGLGHDEPQLGGAFLELQGCFQPLKGDKLYDIYFLVERTKDESGKPFLEILDSCPAFEKDCKALKGEQIPDDGSFSGFPRQIREILKAICQQVTIEHEGE